MSFWGGTLQHKLSLKNTQSSNFVADATLLSLESLFMFGSAAESTQFEENYELVQFSHFVKDFKGLQFLQILPDEKSQTKLSQTQSQTQTKPSQPQTQPKESLDEVIKKYEKAFGIDETAAETDINFYKNLAKDDEELKDILKYGMKFADLKDDKNKRLVQRFEISDYYKAKVNADYAKDLIVLKDGKGRRFIFDFDIVSYFKAKVDIDYIKELVVLRDKKGRSVFDQFYITLFFNTGIPADYVKKMAFLRASEGKLLFDSDVINQAFNDKIKPEDINNYAKSFLDLKTKQGKLIFRGYSIFKFYQNNVDVKEVKEYVNKILDVINKHVKFKPKKEFDWSYKQNIIENNSIIELFKADVDAEYLDKMLSFKDKEGDSVFDGGDISSFYESDVTPEFIEKILEFKNKDGEFLFTAHYSDYMIPYLFDNLVTIDYIKDFLKILQEIKNKDGKPLINKFGSFNLNADTIAKCYNAELPIDFLKKMFCFTDEYGNPIFDEFQLSELFKSKVDLDYFKQIIDIKDDKGKALFDANDLVKFFKEKVKVEDIEKYSKEILKIKNNKGFYIFKENIDDLFFNNIKPEEIKEYAEKVANIFIFSNGKSFFEGRDIIDFFKQKTNVDDIKLYAEKYAKLSDKEGFRLFSSENLKDFIIKKIPTNFIDELLTFKNKEGDYFINDGFCIINLYEQDAKIKAIKDYAEKFIESGAEKLLTFGYDFDDFFLEYIDIDFLKELLTIKKNSEPFYQSAFIIALLYNAKIDIKKLKDYTNQILSVTNKFGEPVLSHPEVAFCFLEDINADFITETLKIGKHSPFFNRLDFAELYRAKADPKELKKFYDKIKDISYENGKPFFQNPDFVSFDQSYRGYIAKLFLAKPDIEKLKAYTQELIKIKNKLGKPIFKDVDLVNLFIENVEINYVKAIKDIIEKKGWRRLDGTKIAGLYKNNISPEKFQKSMEQMLALKTKEGEQLDFEYLVKVLTFGKNVDYVKKLVEEKNYKGYEIYRSAQLGLGLDEILNFKDSEKPNALVVYSKSDWNSAFETQESIDFFKKIKQAYDTYVVFAEKESQVYKGILSIPDIELLILSGHGERERLALKSSFWGEIENEEQALDTSDTEIGEYLSKLHKNCVIFLNSCSNAKEISKPKRFKLKPDDERNLFNHIRKYSGGRLVIASKEPFEGKDVKIKSIYPFDLDIITFKKNITMKGK